MQQQEDKTYAISQYDYIQKSRWYLATYHDINIMSIDCSASLIPVHFLIPYYDLNYDVDYDVK